MGLEDLLGDLPELLGMPFFQWALVGGALIALICATVGLFIVLRKEAMIGDSVAHTAFGGIALGLLLGIDPIIAALALSTLAILGISYMRRKGIAQSDSAMAIMLAAGFSLGIIAIGVSDGFNVAVMDYLFGSILTITVNDLIFIAVLGITVLIVTVLVFKELLAITFDEDASRMNGIPVNGMSMAFNILVAVTIVLSIKVVGIILVVALIVIPVLSALQLNLSFRRTMAASMGFGVGCTVLGIILSGLMDIPASGIIVLTTVAVFMAVAIYQRLGRQR